MRHVSCKREYTKPGQSFRRFAIDDVVPSGRQSSWQVKLLEAADGESPARRLWAAVLRDAIAALRGTHPNSRPWSWQDKEAPAKLWREVCAWILSRDAEPLGTFESICEALDLDVHAVRRDLCTMAVRHTPVQASPVANAVAA